MTTEPAKLPRRPRPNPNPETPPICIEISWSPHARTALEEHVGGRVPPPTVRSLNFAARRAIKQTLRLVPPAAPKPKKSASVSKTLEVVLSIGSDEQIRDLNATYRGKDQPTDVLSFAQDEGEPFPGMPFEESKVHALGDIVVAVETAARQAGERGHALAVEIAFLCVHGTLHLLGYDHMNDDERRLMWEQQAKVWHALYPQAAASDDFISQLE